MKSIKLKMWDNWWMGFMGFFGITGIPWFFNGEKLWLAFWFIFFLWFIPVRKK